MRRAFALLVAAAAPATGWGLAAPAPASAGGAEVVVWHDTAYFRSATPGLRPSPGARLAGAVAPGCNDTGGDPPPPTRVGARAIAGVSPAAAPLFGHTILLAPGYVPQARATASCTITGALTLTGRAHPMPPGFFTIAPSSGG